VPHQNAVQRFQACNTNAATMRELPLDPRSRCNSAEYTTCHYAQT
jgi:hypothetical protein